MSRLPADHVPSIVEAMDDPRLLGAALGGNPETWANWRIVAKAAFALSLDAAEQSVFAEIAGGRALPAGPVRELWCVIGRRSGKSRMAALIASYLAAFSTHSLAPGEVGHVLVLAMSKDQAQTVFGYVRAFFEASPILRQMVSDITADEIRLHGNIAVSVHTNSFRSVRGRTLIACVMDEVSFWRDEASAAPDIEVYRAVMPGLMTTAGVLVGISSPYRKQGLLHQKFEKSFGQDDERILVVQAPTLKFNPLITAERIEQELLEDPEAARSEWNAEFRDDLSDFISRDAVMDCVDIGIRERPPERMHKYIAFYDVALGGGDSTVLAICHKEGNTAVLDAIREARGGGPYNPEAITAEHADLMRQYRISMVTGDRVSGGWIVHEFRKHGIHYQHSERTKSDIYRDALPLINSRAVALLESDRLINQLVGLERRAGRGGRDSVDHAKGGRDDVSNAVCGALVLASAKRVRTPGEQSGAYVVPQADPLAEWNSPRARTDQYAAYSDDPIRGF